MDIKHILIVVNSLEFYISHRHPIGLGALEAGYRVSVAYGEIGSANIEMLAAVGIEAHQIPMHRSGKNFIYELSTIFSICKLFFNIKPDLVHLVTIKPYLYGGLVARILGIHSVVSAVSGMGSLFIGNTIYSRIGRMLLYPAYWLAFNHQNQRIIFQNADDQALFADWGVLKSNKSIILKGSGVDLSAFSRLTEPAGTPVIVFAARLLRDKGVMEFIEAARVLVSRGVKAHFWLAGKIDFGNPSAISEKDLNQWRREGIVEVLGFQKNISEIYANAHIVCLPSYREGLPKSLIEAAAASRAVVTTDVPGCRDAIVPLKTGLLVPSKSHLKLADAIQWLLEHPDKRVKMGRYGRILAEQEFDIKFIVGAHIKIYDELLSF